MISPLALVDEARSWIGTPWVHQGRMKGVQCDCVGLIVEVARTVGVPGAAQFAYPNYPRMPRNNMLELWLDKYLTRSDAIMVGNVALVAWWPFPDVSIKRIPMHLAWIGDYTKHRGSGAPYSFVHAMNDPTIMKVAEHNMNHTWRNRIVRTYRMPGVE